MTHTPTEPIDPATAAPDGQPPARRSGRTGGRAGRQAARAATAIARQPFLTRQIKPYELVSDE